MNARRVQPKLFRIQYEIPPMRAIFESFIEHVDDRCSEADYIAGFKMAHERAVVRKTEWISKAEYDRLCEQRCEHHETEATE